MKYYIYNKNLKAYFTGFFAGMPSWSPSKKQAQVFDCPIEAGDFCWKWATCGRMVVTD